MVPPLKSVILLSMQTWKRIERTAKEFQGGVVTIGNFDGLHLGHQALLKKARECGGPVVVVTFDPHPQQILKPGISLKRLFPREDLMERLPELGVSLLVVLPFDQTLAQVGAEEFWSHYVNEPFKPRHVVAGHDFAFGRDREGNLDFLHRWCESHGATLHVVGPLTKDGELYSSRLIRELVQNGRVEDAAQKLGRYFYLRGEVGSGAGRGATIGIPTMNFKPVQEVIPAQGVYATRTVFENQIFPSVTNIGTNPTFGSQEGIKIETHVMGASLEARGHKVEVQFVKRLRAEKKFTSIEDLKNQIKDDILKAHEALDNDQPHK